MVKMVYPTSDFRGWRSETGEGFMSVGMEKLTDSLSSLMAIVTYPLITTARKSPAVLELWLRLSNVPNTFGYPSPLINPSLTQLKFEVSPYSLRQRGFIRVIM